MMDWDSFNVCYRLLMLPSEWGMVLFSRKNVRFGVIDRYGSAEDVVWVETDPGFSFHVMNAWDNPENPDQVGD